MYWSQGEPSKSPADAGPPARTPHFVIRPRSPATGHSPLDISVAGTSLPPVMFAFPLEPQEAAPVKQHRKRRGKRKRKRRKKGAKRNDAASHEGKPPKDQKESHVTYLGVKEGCWTPPKRNICDSSLLQHVIAEPTPSLLELKNKARSEASSKLTFTANAGNVASATCAPTLDGAPTTKVEGGASSPGLGSCVGHFPPAAISVDKVSEKSHDASEGRNSMQLLPGAGHIKSGIDHSMGSVHSSTKGSTGAAVRKAAPTSGDSVPYVVAAFALLSIAIFLVLLLPNRPARKAVVLAPRKNTPRPLTPPPSKKLPEHMRRMTTTASSTASTKKLVLVNNRRVFRTTNTDIGTISA